ncbi:DNA polymerase I [Mesoplasma syrphidae]|uniref:DNA polymerase I n=1 Tax=Mesoplasma syrphidae TaxID=225999 RepID=A0A2K9BUI3_9MOLU|nr:DNA polymerase I [Mesoplasma syrphidae]AUF83370.1 DNA polymerase I [Mesoplasma syrphidae]
MANKKILLVDGNSLIFRAYFAGAYRGTILTTSTGIPTNAVFSFANMITSLLSNREYYDVKVAFDKGKKTFRHEMLKDYKAGRSQTPDELVQQFPIVREFLDAANISWYELDNIEADDIIGSLTKTIENEIEDCDVEILTSDKDMFQLISDKTVVLIPVSGTSDLKTFGKAELFEKWACTPEQVVDLKGLMGDASDNLKGVAGIGEKTAIKLLTEYGSIEKIYKNLDSIKGAVKIKLEADKDSAFLCKKIATIATNTHVDNLEFRKLNLSINSLVEFLRKYEMFSVTKRLSNRAEQINNEEKHEYQILSSWSNEYACEENSIYVESLEENYHRGQIIGIAISNQKGNFFINFSNIARQLSIFDHNEPEKNFDVALDTFLKNLSYKKSTYDIKRTVTLLKMAGYNVSYDAFDYDMMVASYALNANVKSLFVDHLRLVSPELNITEDEYIYGKGAKRTGEIDLDSKAMFITKKALYIKMTKPDVYEKLKETNQIDLYEKIDLPFVKVLYTTEQNGILIDRQELKAQTLNILNKVNELELHMRDILGDQINDSFNFASPKQIQELLFEKLGLPNLAKGSTGKETLEKLRTEHAVVNLLLEHRKYSKLYSTYLRGFEKFIFDDGKVHTIFNQTLTNTGRLSSSEPNIQNISIHDPAQKEVRKIFVTEDDTLFYSFDYSQIELRVLAQMGNEKTLIDIFNNQRDVHSEAARMIYKLKDNEKVSPEMRRVAKVFNFGIIYGLSDFGLSNDLNISIPEAKNFITAYYEAFPEIATFKSKEIEFAKANGFALTLANRKRKIDELKSTNYQLRQFGERVAVNMPIQGTAADILKVAMINIYNELNKAQLSSKIVAQIHDEIIFEIKNNESQKAVEIIISEMEIAMQKMFEILNLNNEIKVSLSVTQASGENWFKLK